MIDEDYRNYILNIDFRFQEKIKIKVFNQNKVINCIFVIRNIILLSNIIPFIPLTKS